MKSIDWVLRYCFRRSGLRCEWVTKNPQFDDVRCDEIHNTMGKKFNGKCWLKPFYLNYKNVSQRTVRLYCNHHIQKAESLRMKRRLKKAKHAHPLQQKLF